MIRDMCPLFSCDIATPYSSGVIVEFLDECQ